MCQTPIRLSSVYYFVVMLNGGIKISPVKRRRSPCRICRAKCGGPGPSNPELHTQADPKQLQTCFLRRLEALIPIAALF